MEKYHIYEEIGKGKFSQVFKGREKKQIQYVAIKRVDKNMMDKVVNEVQIIHRLDNPHTLKFHDWYETRNNLWLILEFCAGTDLSSLIQQDGHLPEASVRMFSLDILDGLKYLHSIGYLHCDLRPQNILIDEYGTLKISDFKFARKIPKSSLSNQPLSSRGHPKYMAPELFSSEGVHSFASDFWSLGCIIFELRVGFHPFGDRLAKASRGEDVADRVEEEEEEEKASSVGALLDRIRSRDPLLMTGKGRCPALSSALSDVLGWLLEKVPPYRCDWRQLCHHPFWGPQPPKLPGHLPEQAAYEAFVMNHFDGTSEDLADNGLDEESRSALASPTPEVEHYDKKQQQHRRLGGDKLEDSIEHRKPLIKAPPVAEDDQIAAADLLTQLSDAQVKPIVNNRAIESIEKYGIIKSSSVQFQPLTLDQVTSLSQSKIESHLSQVYKNLQGNLGLSSQKAPGSASSATLSERLSLLSYLCSLASNTDVANTVLNTVFVHLLLHILKSPSPSNQRKGLAPSPRSSNNSVKALAATALALFLRYATYVEPPKPPKERDASNNSTLLVVLVNLLRDPSLSRHDLQLRHRALAALGELLFYISAQEEDEEGSDGATNEGPKWVLPSAAASVMTRALGDDGDEISRHYAAKTIENVMAQGGYQARLKFCTLEVALRLMELSQHSRNASIQATSAMALFHLFVTVCHSASGAVLHASGSKKKGKGDEEAMVVSGSQFVSRVLEKGGAGSFVTTLKDGKLRLQQAYLNIYNLVFSPSSRGTSCAALQKVRSSFVRVYAQLLPVICRLVEQGSSAVIRSKAILALSLSCQHHADMTIMLSDHRFHSILMKVVEPVMTEAEKFAGEQNVSGRGGYCMLQLAFGAQRISSSTSIYTGQCLLFFLQTLRSLLCQSLDAIADGLREVGDNVDSGLYQTPTKNRASSRSPGPGSTGKPSDMNPPSSTEKSVLSESAAIISQCNHLKAAITLSSHPSIRRLVISAPFLSSLSRCLNLSSRSDAKLVKSYPEATMEVVLLALEFVSQVCSHGTHHQSPHCMVVQIDPHDSNTIIGDVEVTQILSQVIPAIVRFCGVCKGDHRVVVIASLRRILPPMVPKYFSTQSLALTCVCDVLQQLPLASLLADQAPVPQYTIRLLTEVMNASEAGAQYVAFVVCGGVDHAMKVDSGARSNTRVIQSLLFDSLSGVESSASSHVAHLLSRVLSLHHPLGADLQLNQLDLFPAGLTSTLINLASNASARKDLELLAAVASVTCDCLSFLKLAMASPSGQNGVLEAAEELSRVLSPLMAALVWSSSGRGTSSDENKTQSQELRSLSLHAFSLFLDVVPGALVSRLCEESEDATISFPRTMLAILSKDLLECHDFLKFLGLVLRFVKATVTLPVGHRVVRLIRSEPIYSALLDVRHPDWAGNAHFSSTPEAIDSARHLSAQIINAAEAR